MWTTTVVIGLTLDERDRCLAGRIRSRSGSVPFRGWIGLVAALDRLLAEPEEPPSPPGPGDDHFAKGDLP